MTGLWRQWKKIAAMQEKNFLCVGKCEVLFSNVHSYANNKKAAPGNESILIWFRQFRETICLCRCESKRWLHVLGENLAAHETKPFLLWIEHCFELSIPQITVWNALRRRLHFRPYRLILIKQLTPDDFSRRLVFCSWIQESMADDDELAVKLTRRLSVCRGRNIVTMWECG